MSPDAGPPLRRSLLLRLAWRQSLLRLILLYSLAVVLGALSGQMAWVLFAVTALVAGRAYWRLLRILRYLDWRQQLRTVHGQGLWSALDTLVHRRQTETRARARRLVGLLRAYRQAATAMPDGALVIDRRTLELVWFNKSARRMLGLDYPRSLGTPLTQAVPGTDVEAWLRAAEAPESLPEIPSPVASGVMLSLRRIPYSLEAWLVVVRDVSQLLRLEQVRRDFVANVSHELRTPLTVIHGYLDLMEPDDNPEWAPMVLEMRKQSLRMTGLLEDLLTLSRLEGGEPLEQETVAMAPLLLTLEREARALSQGRHEIVVRDQALLDLLGAGKELHSAFSNLVSNAIRYTPAGGRIGLRFVATDEGGAALIVSDTGFGIPAQHLPRLTERFYRVSTSRSRESGGTGLGLSIVKHVLGLHQARLEIESTVGQGSRFSCVFASARVVARQ